MCLQALVFLLQIQLARMALGQARMRHWKAWQNCEKQKYGAAEPAPAPAPRRQGARQAPATTPLSEKQEELVMQEMTHFVNSTHQFVSERLVYGAWGQLVQVGGPASFSHTKALRSSDQCTQTWRNVVVGGIKFAGRGPGTKP